MKLSCKVLTLVAFVALAAGACSSDKGGSDAAAGSSGGGATGSAGTSGGAGTTGAAGTMGNAGTTGRGGTTGSAGATGGGGVSGSQPIGAACANTSNCSQADGTAVCCLQISTCVIDTQCPSGTNYVPCTDTASCNKGGWICCNAGGMRFCTKQSGCPAP